MTGPYFFLISSPVCLKSLAPFDHNQDGHHNQRNEGEHKSKEPKNKDPGQVIKTVWWKTGKIHPEGIGGHGGAEHGGH